MLGESVFSFVVSRAPKVSQSVAARRHSVVPAIVIAASLVLSGCDLLVSEPGKGDRGKPVIHETTEGLPKTITNSIDMQLALIPTGEFAMGAGPMEEFVDIDERAHRVAISRPFYLGVYEVTLGQFRQFVEATAYKTEGEQGDGRNLGYTGGGSQFDTGPFSWRDPGFPQDDNHPVVLVSWNDAAEFCRWLSHKENRTYRLPTEAEWEWACRAGTTTRFSSGDDESTLTKVANIHTVQPKDDSKAVFWGDGYAFTLPVGSFQPNPFGLYDMHGNVQEWCVDWYEPDYYARSPKIDPQGPTKSTDKRSVRGGSYHIMPWHARSANRAAGTPSYRFYDLGFRVVCEAR